MGGRAAVLKTAIEDLASKGLHPPAIARELGCNEAYAAQITAGLHGGRDPSLPLPELDRRHVRVVRAMGGFPSAWLIEGRRYLLGPDFELWRGRQS